MICRAYSLRKSRKMPFWFLDEGNLSNYHTSKEDKMSGISRVPRKTPIVINVVDALLIYL